MPDIIRKLFRHLQWADEHALSALRTAGPGHAKALELLAHILGAEHVWLARLRQEPSRHAVWPALSLDECAALAKENHAGYVALLDALTAGQLTEDVPYVNSAGRSLRSTAEDMLLQVALHGSYHRGQIALLLRQERAVPEATDFIAFVRGVPAATRRPG